MSKVTVYLLPGQPLSYKRVLYLGPCELKLPRSVAKAHRGKFGPKPDPQARPHPVADMMRESSDRLRGSIGRQSDE